RARLRAREEDGDVLGRVAGQAGDALAADERGGKLVGALLELAVGHAAAEVVDRDAVGGERGAIADPAVDRRRAAHAGARRKAVTSRTKRSGCSQKNTCPACSKRSSFAPGISSARSSAFRGSTTTSSSPWSTSVGAVIPPTRAAASNVAPAAACACQAG